ncbi:hypothetical protein HID58_056006 [Brassica napus]|uniref:BnaC03g57620D protein n=2 Tax=Brassica napus TaxID=3708 RepID=A0A078FEW0_BRANA|nr:squamosa promoter-binding-like protein 10 [Brassica napus]KAH0893577.1 hypothetical protein HID58_056006 [Brassica napus]CAF1709302.1 unnamed protein product [Brassica napus]CDY11816.1 BnaC03g57620D [Brassica napus]
MDCNMASPTWDWDHLIMFNPSETENDKNQQPSPEWEIEKGEGIESMFPCFDGLEKVSSGTPSGFWHSQSTSTNSSSPKVKQTNLASESSPGDSCSNVDSVYVKASTSAESDLCLELGKQTYSEEFWCRDNNDLSAVSMNARKKQSVQVPRCQIDGCELDLSSAKDYHRKHRVCVNHSKCPKVTVGGLERRFCQQCSRLHAVSEFDEKKRSCRKRLTHHNARRRKLPGIFPLNPERVCNPRHHTNMLWDEMSLNTKSEETLAWDTTYDTKPTQIESGFTLSFQRGHGRPDEQVVAGSSRSFSPYQTSSGFQLPSKGVGEYSGGLNESQDFYSALSLLSTSSDSRGTKHNPMVESQPIHGTFPTHFM